MRWNTWVVATAAILLAVGYGPAASSQGRKTPERAILYPNYGPPPTSFDELWNGSTLIVRGTVQESHVRRSMLTGTPSVVTDHRVRASEVLKGNLPGGESRTLHVLQDAGTLVIDGKQIVVDPGAMPVIAPGQEALFFLTEWPKGGGHSIVAGPAGLYILDEPSVLVPAFASDVFGTKKSISKDDFLSAVRQRANRK